MSYLLKIFVDNTCSRFKGHRTNITCNNNNNNINKYHKNVINTIVTKDGLNLNTNTHESNIPIRKKPLYHNCYLQAPDGDILCTCDRKKAEWYIKKNLADIVEEQPFTVRLKFEPSGRALGEVGQYYTQIKINQCVVCGASENFIRKNVVPREYRKYFPCELSPGTKMYIYTNLFHSSKYINNIM